MMQESFPLWEQLERESGKKLYMWVNVECICVVVVPTLCQLTAVIG